MRNRFDRGAIIAGSIGSAVLIVGWIVSTGIVGPLAKSWCTSGAINQISLWALGLSLLALVPAAPIDWGIPIPPYKSKTKEKSPRYAGEAELRSGLAGATAYASNHATCNVY